MELCRGGCDLVIVVGGFGSSNTRHLFELARGYCPAYFIEDAAAILSAERLRTFDPAAGRPVVAEGWLPAQAPAADRRPGRGVQPRGRRRRSPPTPGRVPRWRPRHRPGGGRCQNGRVGPCRMQGLAGAGEEGQEG